ncbi:protein fuzzy homolog [Clupea harengus]|uniref:Protein fuzzy homolog n=1 Tax=Clupea harengus TaxID=7950 RepID=A0A6P8F7K9_CLUHA|nr:protein fuzzy homolog [Clupea harengus]XP_031419137.1 protein fuzzy homolog [Clupea harengus]
MLQAEGVQLLCLTASSGVPLFSRGSTKQLPFSVIGSLNGVHMFGGGQGALLSCCETDRGARVVWRVFRDSVMLIAVSSGGDSTVTELQLCRLLENTWNCMVLVLGQEELSNVRNVERLKRDLRSCYRLIDQLLDPGDDESVMGYLTNCADCLLPPNPSLLQEALDAFTQAADSEFGCLLIRGRVAVATEKWWRLVSQEVVLLSLLVRCMSGTTSCDYPVFLPVGSPTVAHRLLRFQLLQGVDVCTLCGPAPSLHHAKTELVGRFWSPLMETLHGLLAQTQHTPVPSIALHPDILALLLINRETSRSLSVPGRPPAVTPQDGVPPLPSSSRRWELLRLFYTFAITRYFTSGEAAAPPAEPLQEDFSQGFCHTPLHCYLVTEECKCYGLQTPQHQLFLLAALTMPTFALRSIATQTLTSITAATGF